jgi:hypothetical protein
MPLANLVEYFNNRFELEHQANYRPLFLEQNRVCGLFGQVKVSSEFAPLRQTTNSSHVFGHSVKIKVSPEHIQNLQQIRFADALEESEINSVISFDRLVRTVHMLNYLPFSTPHNFLFLEVDPRHVLGVKEDHGAYFEAVIERCGLTVRNTVIVLGINHSYVKYNESLIRGLSNYRRRGYQIALRFDSLLSDKHICELIFKLSPDYVSLSARQISLEHRNYALDKLQTLKRIISRAQGKGILRRVDDLKEPCLVRDSGFEFVESRHYEYH